MPWDIDSGPPGPEGPAGPPGADGDKGDKGDKGDTGDSGLTADQTAALAGTSGSPSGSNKYVTDQDARNSNARTPTAHGHAEGDVTNLVSDLAAKATSADISTAVSAHAGLSTGVHGVGGSTVESVSGSAAKVTAHEAASDPHTGYQKESEKDAASGYAGLDANARLVDTKIQVAATDKVIGRVTAGAGAAEEIACTSAGRALIDDADASAQRTTLGLAGMATVADAPADGSVYGRQNNAWAVAGGGSGLTQAQVLARVSFRG